MMRLASMRTGWPALAALVALLAVPSAARAWPTGGCVDAPFHVHADIAAHVLDDPAIAPYLAPLGLSRDAIVAAARLEPQCALGYHPSWTELRDLAHLGWPPTDVNAGAILHVAGDGGVPSCHAPANEVWCNNSAETRVEADGELAGVPALTDLYPGTFAEQSTAFHDEEVANASAFQTYVDGNPLCPLLCSTTTYAVSGMTQGQKYAHAALLVWLIHHLPELPDAGPEGGETGDAGEVVEPDVEPDGGPDAALDDSSGPDADADDAAVVDRADAAPDAPDADVPVDVPDDGVTDDGADSSEPPESGGGCGCRASSDGPGDWGFPLVLLLAV
jgi:hypothetical protein